MGFLWQNGYLVSIFTFTYAFFLLEFWNIFLNNIHRDTSGMGKRQFSLPAAHVSQGNSKNEEVAEWCSKQGGTIKMASVLGNNEDVFIMALSS